MLRLGGTHAGNSSTCLLLKSCCCDRYFLT